jgi:hypothetical protein
LLRRVHFAQQEEHKKEKAIRHAVPVWLECLKRRTATAKGFVHPAQQDSTRTAPTHQHAKYVILESIKNNREKQRVFHACLESLDEQIQQIVATVMHVKLVQHPLSLVAKRRANRLVLVRLFLVVVQRQSKFQTART